MVWPTGAVNITNMNSGSGNLSLARVDILDMANKTQALIDSDPTADITAAAAAAATANATANAANASISGADARYGSGMFNLTAVASAAGNLTMNVTGPFKADFRNANLTIGTPVVVSVPGNLSLTVPTGATLGGSVNVTGSLVPLFLQSGGNVSLGLVNPVGFDFDESRTLNSSVLNSSSNSSGVVYSAVAVSNATFKPVSLLNLNMAVAGNYSGAIQKVQPLGGNAKVGYFKFMEFPAVATTSGTVVDFSGLPSWCKRFTLGLGAVSLDSFAELIFQLGTPSGFETSGYSGYSSYQQGGGGAQLNSGSTGFRLYGTAGAANANVGTAVFTKLYGNTWQINASFSSDSGSWVTALVTGSKTLADVFTKLRITSSTGTANFDGGFAGGLAEG